MKWDSDTVSSSGQISSSTERVSSIEFHARSDNEKSVIVGTSTVSATRGREIPPGESVTFNFGEGSVPLNTFYAVVEAGDKLDWTPII